MASEQTIAPRKVQLTTRSGVEISRLLPHQQLRAVGAWVFLDYYGPTDQREAMSVGAHPHVGLQTVSWLFSGEIEHRDSLDNTQVITPGELNLMTAGAGIAHSELSLATKSQLHGVQLWTVLPESVRHTEPTFAHYSDLPVFRQGSLEYKLFMGELLGHRSPASMYSPMVGAEIAIDPQAASIITPELNFEYGLLLIEGDLTINGSPIPVGHLHYLPVGSKEISMATSTGSRLIFLGGEPFTEQIIMWWNFIGRSHDEIVTMRDDWNSPDPTIPAYTDHINHRIPAPELPSIHLSARSLQR